MSESPVCENGRRPTPLTAHDNNILHLIFNESEQFDDSDVSKPANPESQTNTNADSEEETEATIEAGRLEVDAVRAAEAGDSQKALDLLTEVIRLTPDRPSGYNNRAQVHRLNNNIPSAEADLDKTIVLSKGLGQAACQAYVQRGLLRRLRDEIDGATDDFQHAARLGSSFAKSQLVALNPYAQLCGAMVAEMLELERRGGAQHIADN